MMDSYPLLTVVPQSLLPPWTSLVQYREDLVGLATGVPLTLFTLVVLPALVTGVVVRRYYTKRMAHLEHRVERREEENAALQSLVLRSAEARTQQQPESGRRTVTAAQRATLARLVEKGLETRATYITFAPVPRTVAEEWDTEVYQYLERTFDHATAVQFRRPATQFLPTPRTDLSEANKHMYAYCNLRLARLDECIAKLSS